MKRAKSIATSLLACALIIGFGMISNACTGQSPLGIAYEDDEKNLVQEQPVLPDLPTSVPQPADGDE